MGADYSTFTSGTGERGNEVVTSANPLPVTLGGVAVDTELPAAAALADNTANPTAPAIGAHALVWDGATWDRLPGDSTNGADVDVIRVPAPLNLVGGGVEAAALRVTIASDSTGVLSVDDNGASLTVDNAALSVVGGGVEATAIRVTIASDSTGVLSVDDNGGALTVDGTVAISGTVTVDSELMAAAALADGASATPTTPSVGAVPLLMNATTVDRQRAVINTLNSTGTGIAAVGLVAQLDDTSPTAMTENQFGPLRMNRNRMLYAVAPKDWAVQHTPAANTRATIARAAQGAGIQQVCTSITCTVAAAAAPTAAQWVFKLHDGVQDTGTILWSGTVALQAVAGDRAGIVISGLHIVGTANTAMTLEATSGSGRSANSFEQVSMTGYDEIA